MTSAQDMDLGEEPIGPGTDLVISLFCTFLVLAVLSAAFNANIEQLRRTAKAKQDARNPPKGQVIVLDPVSDGLQYFPRQGTTINPALRGAIVSRLSPLRDHLKSADGKLIVHIIGHASPEPFGYDDGGANFELALNRAMSIARLLHEELSIPFECLRVQGVGRGESPELGTWLKTHPRQGPATWDDEYRQKRDLERRTWPRGEDDWRDRYNEGKTELGKELGGERNVVLRTEYVHSVVCARAFSASSLSQK